MNKDIIHNPRFRAAPRGHGGAVQVTEPRGRTGPDTLTIVLTVILCLRYRQSVEFSSIVIIIANILGYLLGNQGNRIKF